MVHIVKKKKNGKVYLYLYNNVYITYLGREEEWTDKKIKKEIDRYKDVLGGTK